MKDRQHAQPYDYSRLQRVVRKAAEQTTQSSPWQRDDLEGELILWVLERLNTRVGEYLTGGMAPEEAEAKLLHTLRVEANKYLRKEYTRQENETSSPTLTRPDSYQDSVRKNTVEWKRCDMTELEEILKHVHQEDIQISAHMREKVSSVRASLYSLPPRQRQVIIEISKGKSLAAIGRELGITRQGVYDAKKKAMNTLQFNTTFRVLSGNRSYDSSSLLHV